MMRRLCILTALVLSCFAFGVTSQNQAVPKEQAKLDALLKQLGSTSPAAWETRLKALRTRARQLDQQAAKLSNQAAGARRRAAAARAEHERLQKLMALVKRKSAKPTKKPAMGSKKESKQMAAKKKPGPKKAPQKKSQPKGTPPKTTPPKKTPPKKKASPKTPPAKKPSSKAANAKKKPLAKAQTPPAMRAAKKKMAARPKPRPKAAEKVAAIAVPANGFITYDDHVQEIFMDNCSACHDDGSKEGGLDLTSFAATRAGGSSGTTIVAGDIDQSRLYQLVAHLQKPTMPPDEAKIEQKSIDLIRSWIEQGAHQNVASARAGARKAASKPKPKVALRTTFDGPPPLPKNWPAVPLAPAQRAVGTKTLATSPRAPLVALPGLGQVHVLNSSTGKRVGTLPFPYGSVEVLRFSADGSRLLAAGGIPGKRGRVVLYQVVDGKVAGTFGREFDTVLAAAIHPQLTHIALGGPNRKVRVFDTRTGDQLYEIDDHNDWILALDFSSDGKHLLSCDRAGVILLSEARDGRNVETVRRHRGAVHDVRFAPGGQRFASVGADSTLRLFTTKGAKQATQRSLGTPGHGLAFSFDGASIAVGGRDGRIRVFRKNGSPLYTTQPVGDWVYAIGFGHQSKSVLGGDFLGRTSVYDLKTRRRLHLLNPTAPPPAANRGL